MADGTLRFDTKVDSKGYVKGLQEISSKSMKLEHDLSRVNQEAANIETTLKRMAETPLDAKSLDKMSEKTSKLENQLDELYEKRGRLENQLEIGGISDSDNQALYAKSKEWSKLTAQIQKAETELSGYNTREAQIASNGATQADTDAYARKQLQLQRCKDRAEEYRQKIAEVKKKEEETATSAGNIGKGIKKSTSFLEQFEKRVKSLAKRIFIFSLITRAMRSLLGYMKTTIGADQQASDALKDLMYNLRVAFMPIYSIIMPAIRTFLRGLATMAEWIGRVAAALSGTTYEAAQSAADAMDAATGKTEDYTDAMKEAQNVTAGFDQLNNLGGEGTSGSGSSSGGTGEVVTGDYAIAGAKVPSLIKTTWELALKLAGDFVGAGMNVGNWIYKMLSGDDTNYGTWTEQLQVVIETVFSGEWKDALALWTADIDAAWNEAFGYGLTESIDVILHPDKYKTDDTKGFFEWLTGNPYEEDSSVGGAIQSVKDWMSGYVETPSATEEQRNYADMSDSELMACVMAGLISPDEYLKYHGHPRETMQDVAKRNALETATAFFSAFSQKTALMTPEARANLANALNNAGIGAKQAAQVSGFDTANSLRSGLSTGLAQNKGSIAGALTGIINSSASSLKTFISGATFKSTLSGIGSNIVGGVVTGIKSSSTVSSLTSAVKSVATSAVDIFKSALGIHSPSTVFAWLGQMMGAGVETGWNSTESATLSAVKTYANAIPGAFQVPAMATGSVVPAGVGGSSSSGSYWKQMLTLLERIANTSGNVTIEGDMAGLWRAVKDMYQSEIERTGIDPLLGV